MPEEVRVALAEDDAIIRLDLRETLEEEGYTVVGDTGRGDEMLELVAATDPEVVILDIKMPGMDGMSCSIG
jgi:response regulator NasT